MGTEVRCTSKTVMIKHHVSSMCRKEVWYPANDGGRLSFKCDSAETASKLVEEFDRVSSIPLPALYRRPTTVNWEATTTVRSRSDTCTTSPTSSVDGEWVVSAKRRLMQRLYQNGC